MDRHGLQIKANTRIKLFYDEKSTEHQIGLVKIYSRVLDDPNNELSSVAIYLPNTIDMLGEEFCSLGGDLNFYVNLKKIFPDEYDEILRRLRDIATDNNIYNDYKDYIGVQKSLLRESSAKKALHEAKYVLQNDKLEEKDISFPCLYKAPYSVNFLKL